MRKLRILKMVLVQTRTLQVVGFYLLFLMLDALVILLAEPGIQSYGDALWYCYAVLSTVGFGDLVAVTVVGKVASVALTVYSLIALALVTGVAVNYYSQLIKVKQRGSLEEYFDQLQRLPELSREELQDLSERAIRFFQETPGAGREVGDGHDKR